MAFGVRHQSACATRQSAASCNATVSGAGNSGHEPGERRSRSGVAGRSVGGGDCADPLFHPNNDGVTETCITVSREPGAVQPFENNWSEHWQGRWGARCVICGRCITLMVWLSPEIHDSDGDR